MHSEETLGDGRGFRGWPTGSGQPRRPKPRLFRVPVGHHFIGMGRSLGFDDWPMSMYTCADLDTRVKPFSWPPRCNQYKVGFTALPSRATNRQTLRSDEINSAIKVLHCGANETASLSVAVLEPLRTAQISDRRSGY